MSYFDKDYNLAFRISRQAKKPAMQSNYLVKIITNASLRPQVENRWAYQDRFTYSSTVIYLSGIKF